MRSLGTPAIKAMEMANVTVQQLIAHEQVDGLPMLTT
jgi:hypothetical protein